MSKPVTLEQVEALAAQLSPRDRLRLVAHVCNQLSASASPPMSEAEFAAWAKECDEVAELWKGDFDSAADLRRIRDDE